MPPPGGAPQQPTQPQAPNPFAPQPVAGQGYTGTQQAMPDGTQSGTIMVNGGNFQPIYFQWKSSKTE